MVESLEATKAELAARSVEVDEPQLPGGEEGPPQLLDRRPGREPHRVGAVAGRACAWHVCGRFPEL